MTFVLLLPCLFLFTACGEVKSLNNRTYIYSKVEVTGDLVKEEYEKEYRNISFAFGESTVNYVDGMNEDTFDYKLENGKVYLAGEGDEFTEDVFAEISGDNMVITETYDGGVVKVYFKVK